MASVTSPPWYDVWCGGIVLHPGLPGAQPALLSAVCVCTEECADRDRTEEEGTGRAGSKHGQRIYLYILCIKAPARRLQSRFDATSVLCLLSVAGLSGRIMSYIFSSESISPPSHSGLFRWREFKNGQMLIERKKNSWRAATREGPR